MAEEKESTSVPLSQTGGNGGEDPEDPEKTPPASPNSSTRKASERLLIWDLSGKIWGIFWKRYKNLACEFQISEKF
ncbi:hypothetical protein CK203_067042 [Vitis vinifera]|uniref:Uncharacterized protein n=1 Tax=Vitis vinifera TaxID=29760 RepID=A0A438F5L2_VITVI|nr:hypothetical protein CK203_067042 [Vitis vinifera]